MRCIYLPRNVKVALSQLLAHYSFHSVFYFICYQISCQVVQSRRCHGFSFRLSLMRFTLMQHPFASALNRCSVWLCIRFRKDYCFADWGVDSVGSESGGRHLQRCLVLFYVALDPKVDRIAGSFTLSSFCILNIYEDQIHHACKISLWNLLRLLRKPQKILYALLFCRTLYIVKFA